MSGSEAADGPVTGGGGAADQLLCEHRWVPAEGEEPRCASCDLGYGDYVGGTVRAALSRMGMWDD
ncbi:hypothetical protein [Ornithinimicrobium pekingense]|uniref:Uncharacterized protein n=1 Tax=Ornithinimicrobium pekingense TaxID=384677 RepID=A0ABQ2F6X4_9MICO|nr:hypothetical protein [Ornithinimicrobium pekingense]GGK67956.1 hypothetical protein GCM10011509_15410 [Ornithinimicrobium pekingense]